MELFSIRIQRTFQLVSTILDVVNYKFHFLELFTGYTNYMLTWAYLLENPS